MTVTIMTTPEEAKDQTLTETTGEPTPTEEVEEVEEEGEAKEEKKKKEAPVKEEEEEEISEERTYTIPLGHAWIAPIGVRTPKAVKLVRGFIERHMKPKEIKMDGDLNRFLWSRGIEKPPRRVRVRATKNTEGVVKVHLVKGE